MGFNYMLTGSSSIPDPGTRYRNSGPVYDKMVMLLGQSPSGMSRNSLVEALSRPDQKLGYSRWSIERIVTRYSHFLEEHDVLTISISTGSMSMNQLYERSGLNRQDFRNYLTWLENANIISFARGQNKQRKVGYFSETEIELFIRIGTHRSELGPVDAIRKSLAEIYDQAAVEQFNTFWEKNLQIQSARNKLQMDRKRLAKIKEGSLTIVNHAIFTMVARDYDDTLYRTLVESGTDDDPDMKFLSYAHDILVDRFARYFWRNHEDTTNSYPQNLYFAIVARNTHEISEAKDKVVKFGLDQLLQSTDLVPDMGVNDEVFAAELQNWLQKRFSSMTNIFNSAMDRIERTSQSTETSRGVEIIRARYPASGTKIRLEDIYHEGLPPGHGKVTPERVRQLEKPVLKLLRESLEQRLTALLEK